MRSIYLLCVIVFCASFAAMAQVFPSSSGSCSVSPTGLMDCDWVSAIELAGKNTENGRAQLFVTRYVLAPGAALSRPVPGYDSLVVGMNDGELANESTSPQTRVNVTAGSVMLMLKEETYLLRNIGKQSLEVLLVQIRK